MWLVLTGRGVGLGAKYRYTLCPCRRLEFVCRCEGDDAEINDGGEIREKDGVSSGCVKSGNCVNIQE